MMKSNRERVVDAYKILIANGSTVPTQPTISGIDDMDFDTIMGHVADFLEQSIGGHDEEG